MDHLYELPPRSASMPSPGTVFPPGFFQPLLSPAPIQGYPPRKMSGRRDSEMVLSEGPITPPESPSPEDLNMSHPYHPQAQNQPLSQQLHQQQQPLEVVMEDMSQPVQVEYPVTPVSQAPENPDAMDEDSTTQNEQNLSIVRQPVRSLSQENLDLPRTNTVKLTDFEVRGTLGTGTFGRVLLVRLRNAPTRQDSANYFAMKILSKKEIVRLRQVEHVAAERYILSRIRHPFIVDLYATFQDQENVYMLLSYVPGGELFTHLRRAQRFTPDVTRFYLATIVLALRYLHSFNIVYRDLKPENLLLDSRGYLRLTDFGFAKLVDDRTWTLCGTPEYLAPEIIRSEGHGKAADWWACGILCYEMLVGFPPFFAENAFDIYKKILEGRIWWPRDMDPLSRELIKALLHPDLSKRLGNMNGGPQDVLDHPWFRGVDWGALERREIKAPIIPHTSSSDDTRHFARLELPPRSDIPGLFPIDERPSLRPLQRYEHIHYDYSLYAQAQAIPV
ncbi:Pkinase-domain-containing protein [Sanghuangporus baumii]|uniref:cAMP-dependent protein kinase n=1 Tax=Sanghuangporus baumii TaxID=108892 RepID=A0A9Q5HQN7_SANBA|nr:Pkinase-domain-containing protein [Sanghuangporus baumii]